MLFFNCEELRAAFYRTLGLMSKAGFLAADLRKKTQNKIREVTLLICCSDLRFSVFMCGSLILSKPTAQRGLLHDDCLSSLRSSGNQADLGADLFGEEIYIGTSFRGEGTHLGHAQR